MYEMDTLNPKPSYSKELINCDLKNNHDHGIKPYNIKYEEEMENNTIMPLPQLPHLNYHSDYEKYNNNCMLTNLNDFGLRYFNINTDDETVEEYPHNDNHTDSSINDIEEIFKRLSQEFDEGNSKEAEVDDSVNVLNENIDILNLDGLQKHVNKTCYSQGSAVDSYQNVFQQNISYEEHEHLEECNNRPKYCDEYLELFQDNIEQVLKCNLITRVCGTHTVNEIPTDRENILINDNKFPDLHNVIKYDHDILVNLESKNCLLVNDKEIIESASNHSETKSDNTDACSYHSSDFEFIDEEEAKKECKLNMGPIIDKVKNVANKTKDFDGNYTINDYFSKPYQANDNSIPSGNDYHNLFLIQNIPFSCLNIENKALSSIKGMEVSSGNNTDLKYLFKGDPKYIKEAEKTAQIILSMYPTENKTAHNLRS
ncbi:uncharacterized protein LOC121737332 isoform X2 [Aricia agestis]|nr:uncharacterized protein LOC121737332 isoform X2 [Aricia agestis]XP_041984941.1 uncharacterized protein LOC121737332 isoform X2 [Aricia agestis]